MSIHGHVLFKISVLENWNIVQFSYILFYLYIGHLKKNSHQEHNNKNEKKEPNNPRYTDNQNHSLKMYGLDFHAVLVTLKSNH